jgi:hypothetical protein
VTRGCLRAGILHFSLLELLLGANTPSIIAGILRLVVAALRQAGISIFLWLFLLGMATSAPGTSLMLQFSTY